MPNIALPGIAATGALGTPTITGGAAPQNISLPGIAMSALLGTPTITVGGGAQNVSLPSITATGTLGSPTIALVASGAQNIALSGIAATATLGSPTIALGGAPGGGGGAVATPGVAPNRLPYPDVVKATESGEALNPRGVQANFEKLASTTAGGGQIGPAGPPGATGATGPPGAAGATGATGPTGPAGTSYVIRTARVAITNLAASATTTVTVTWPTAFADTNYTWTWSIRTTTGGANDLRVLTALDKTASAVTVLVANTTAGGPESGVLECIAVHD